MSREGSARPGKLKSGTGRRSQSRTPQAKTHGSEARPGLRGMYFNEKSWENAFRRIPSVKSHGKTRDGRFTSTRYGVCAVIGKAEEATRDSDRPPVKQDDFDVTQRGIIEFQKAVRKGRPSAAGVSQGGPRPQSPPPGARHFQVKRYKKPCQPSQVASGTEDKDSVRHGRFISSWAARRHPGFFHLRADPKLGANRRCSPNGGPPAQHGQYQRPSWISSSACAIRNSVETWWS